MDDFLSVLEAISQVLAIIGSLISLGSFVWVLIVGVVTSLVSLACYLVTAIPAFVVAKHAGCKWAWLAWVPVCQGLFITFVLSKISGKEKFEFAYGKFTMEQNALVMLIYVLIAFFGNALISLVVLILSLIPVLGQILAILSPLVYLIPQAAMAVVEYVYLRDTLNVFKVDEKTNRIHAFVVTVLDALITFGWARTIYLMTMMRKHPLPPAFYAEKETVQQPVTE